MGTIISKRTRHLFMMLFWAMFSVYIAFNFWPRGTVDRPIWEGPAAIFLISVGLLFVFLRFRRWRKG